MCPLNEASRLQCVVEGARAPGASARDRDSLRGAGAHLGGALRSVTALFSRETARAIDGSVDVLEATLGEDIFELVDPIAVPRSPTREDISVVSPVGSRKTSDDCETPTCQELAAAHRWVGRVRSQRETYGDGYGRQSRSGADFLPADFASLDI
jgi:hypothetical protein